MIRAQSLASVGLGRFDLSISIPPRAVIVGPTGSGKSHALAALELAVRGAITGSPLVSLPQTHAGLMRFARDGRTVRVSVSGTSDEHGAWSVAREYTTTQTRPKKPGGEPKISIEGTCQQSFVPAATTQDHASAVAEYLSTLEEVWDPRKLLQRSAGELRRKLLGRLLDGGSLAEYLPRDVPDWLRGSEHLAPEPWVRLALEKARKRKSSDEETVRVSAAIIERSVGGKPVDVAPLEHARDRAVARLAAYDAAATRAAERERAERELSEAEIALAGVPTPTATVADLSAELARAQRAEQLDAEIESLPAAAPEAPTAAEVDALRARRDELAERVAERGRMSVERERLRREYAEATAQIERLEALLCPHCGRPVEVSELETWRAKAGSIRARGEDLAAKIAEIPADIEATLREAQSAFGAASNARARADSDGRAVARRAALVEERERLGAPGSVAEAQRELADRQAWERARQRVARAEAALSGLTAGAPEGDRDTLAEAIEAAKRLHSEALERNAEIRQRDEAARDRDDSAARVDEAAEWIARLAEIQRTMLGDVSERLLAPLRQLTGLAVTLQLEDDRGNEDCQFRLGSGSASTLSGGESLLFIAGLIGAMYAVTPRAECRWRPLILDRIESISLAERERFIGRVGELLADKVFDQALLAGCPDTLPKVRGLITMGGV